MTEVGCPVENIQNQLALTGKHLISGYCIVVLLFLLFTYVIVRPQHSMLSYCFMLSNWTLEFNCVHCIVYLSVSIYFEISSISCQMYQLCGTVP